MILRYHNLNYLQVVSVEKMDKEELKEIIAQRFPNLAVIIQKIIRLVKPRGIYYGKKIWWWGPEGGGGLMAAGEKLRLRWEKGENKTPLFFSPCTWELDINFVKYYGDGVDSGLQGK